MNKSNSTAVPVQVEANLQKQIVIISPSDKNGRSLHCEGLESNLYSQMWHVNGCSPLWEGLSSNL